MNIVSRTALICVTCLIVYAFSQQVDPKTDVGSDGSSTAISSSIFEDQSGVVSITTDASSISTIIETDSENATEPIETSSLEETSSLAPDQNISDISKPSVATNGDTFVTGTASDGDEGSGDVTIANQTATVLDYDDDDTNSTTTIPQDEGEANRTSCSWKPCRNGGTCVEDDAISSLFSCVCPPGYVGIRCSTKDECIEGYDGELCKNGACVQGIAPNGPVRFCNCFRGTYWDKEMKECREPEPPCFPNPCLNGGICSIKDYTPLCDCRSGFQGSNCSIQDKCGDCERGTCVLEDNGTTKYCRCNEGLYWSEESKTCAEIVSPCDTSPCHNGGTCVVISDTEYNCTCGSHFSGRRCGTRDLCRTDEDCKDGICVHHVAESLRKCHCDMGFYFEWWTHQCEEVSVCHPNPCWNDGICNPLSTTAFNCTCSEGLAGARCDVRDRCKLDGGDAYCRNGLCTNNFELGVYFCTCKDKEYFQYSERKCVELDFCPLVECGITEMCSMGKCVCKENYKWNNVTEKCEPDFCSSNPCPLPEMTCEEGTGSTDYKCSCQEGYAFNGTYCNEAFCTFPSLSPCSQMCSLTDNGYKCICEDDFNLKGDNHTCEYTGNQTCTNKTCDGGFCVQKNGIESCLCPSGYIEVDGNCVDVCSAGNLTAGVCPQNECEVAKEGGFRCKCEDKFALSKDKTTCTVRNICEVQEFGWKTCTERKAECVVDWEFGFGFKCQCTRGMVKTEGGVCQELCSLESNQRQCSIKGARCDVDAKGRMTCRCPPYFKENGRDGKCTQPADFSYLVTLPLDKSTYLIGNGRQRSMIGASIDYWKISKDITIAIREMFAEFTQANVLSCKLASGSDTNLCKVELQFSTKHAADLKRLGTEDICLTNGNSNKCLIPPTLVLVKNRISTDVDIQATDPCDEDISFLVCGSETTCVSSLSDKSFNCSCKTGFYAKRKNYPFGNTRSFIEICADIDECFVSDPCPANSICTNTIGNYTCSCKPGYRSVGDAPASNAQNCVELCSPNPCTHGSCSARGDHEFDCTCEAGFRGTFCNLEDVNFKHARTNTVIVGVVLGGILLITLILFATYISRLKKKKFLESDGHMYYNSAEMTERRRVEGGVVNNAYRRE